jgi:hypothetical protein
VLALRTRTMSKQPVQETKLLQVAGVWTIYYKGQEYLRLLDATSRADAEQQLSEMLRTVQSATNVQAACSISTLLKHSSFSE